MLINNKQCTTVLNKIKALILNWGAILIPSSCIFCRQILTNQRDMGVCPACFGTLPFWDKADVSMPSIPQNVDSFDAPFLYRNPINHAITQMKFTDKPEYAPALAQFMIEKVQSCVTKNYLIMPVPMHKKRLFRRQFNQAALLVNALRSSFQENIELFALKRIRATAPQLGKSAAARKSNLAAAFAVDTTVVAGKNIILIDDVWTTGSTAEACARCLKHAGAKRVDVVTICFVENSI